MRDPSSDQPGRKDTFRNMTLAVLAGQVGCLTLVIVLAALFAGLWLDTQFDTKPMYTLVLILASVPVSLVVMFIVARSAISKIKAGPAPVKPVKMEGDIDDDNGTTA